MSAHPTGGFSLFPNPNDDPRPPSRSQSRPRATSPRSGRRGSTAREEKHRAVSNNPWQHALDAARSAAAGPSTAPDAADDAVVETAVSQPVTDPPQRCETAFSDAQTLVRSSSQRSRSSIAKPPIAHTTAGPSSSSRSGESQEPGAIRSIFPRYNPDLPLSQQEYYPTQASPTHIPQSAISRPLYSPPRAAAAAAAEASSNAPAAAHTAGPPPHAGHSAARWPPFMGQRHHEPAVMPSVSTTEDLRGLWKVANGWRASGSEGRNYCLKMTASPDLPPSYTVSSSTGHPFYCLRVEPTSSSALVTLHRYDPTKPFKPASPSAGSTSARASPDGGGGGSTPSPRASLSSRQSNYPVVPQTTAYSPSNTARKYQKNWQEVLSTHLAPAPLLPSSSSGGPDSDLSSRAAAAAAAAADENDGLVAQLWPAAAARLVADRANDATTVALAQQESARLVWDADSGHHFLVHPALAVPFCVTVDRHPALSRAEYALEHLESPAHLARLVRDGTGSGWLEVDTAVAAKVDAVYLVDVAVAALVLVAHLDSKKNNGSPARAGNGGGGGLEVFEPPPVVYGGPNGSVYSGGGDGGRRSSRSARRVVSRASGRREDREQGGGEGKERYGRKKRRRRRPAEQFELDLESQSSDLGKGKGGADLDKDRVPGVLRALVGLVTVTFKCLVWCATLGVKMLVGVLSLFTRCCGLGKL
ncbi:hypothetical protein MYCTH_2296167 [Thermothelomyces thermophilus ATCC 42464]|uniref:Acetylserotonin methytransferase-like protein n=1 Tax=Thermothelomyces thermophilus (strain ATCC 42464 / BCRC 31852 / DSM 1799) TaxID=573729 RepID=G2Q0X1_THET4|nr:uncharacterized protein MYCTH_2296167 [Thermothelomyces thermophilus ATCC 42464]AEO54069.1 hypothetical protein MYCTH_2296167 [Thermothelomyces thermophilus ATCC 42464]